MVTLALQKTFASVYFIQHVLDFVEKLSVCDHTQVKLCCRGPDIS